MLKWSTIALRVEETKAVFIPTIVIKVRYNALMVFDVWCEKGLYATFQRGI